MSQDIKIGKSRAFIDTFLGSLSGLGYIVSRRNVPFPSI
jgi:hypothetical protein